jgi:hypothetical protein
MFTKIASLFLCSTFIVGCTNIETDYNRIVDSDNNVKVEFENFDKLENNPLSYSRHFAIGLSYFLKTKKTNYDLHIARVAFETSWRLSRDFWPSAVYLALTYDKLGFYPQSLESFIEAANIHDHASLWRAASISALKSGYERLSFELYHRSKIARIQVDDKINAYLESSFDAMKAKELNIVKEIKPISNEKSIENDFECVAENVNPPKKENGDNNDNSDDKSSDKDDENNIKKAAYKTYDNDICNTTNFYIQSFIITREQNITESNGIDLISALKLTLGSTLYDFDRTATITDSVNTTTSIYKNSLSAVIPNITYALSIANESGQLSSVDATPSFVISLGQESDLFDGSSFDVIASSSDSTSHFTKDLGVKLQAYIYRFNQKNIGINIYSSLSTPSGTAAFNNFQVFRNDKLDNTNIFTMPINKAVIVASFSSDILNKSGNGQSNIKDIPVLGKLFGVEKYASEKRDVLIISFIRSDLQKESQQIEELNLLSKYKFDSNNTIFRYGYIYNAPDVGLIEDVFSDNIKSFLDKNTLLK